MGLRSGLQGHDPNELIRRAQAGDDRAREEILERFIPFAVGVASRQVGRYLSRGQDEEVSVALIALNEAIDAYRTDRGRAFAGFVGQVVRRRLVDQHRRMTRREVVASDLEEEDEDGHPQLVAFDQEAVLHHVREEETTDRREEIFLYQRELIKFGLDLGELVRLSPRHADARRTALAVARLVAADPSLRNYLVGRRELPLKDLAQRVSISRKTLERHRRYIIALAVALCGDFPFLKDYLGKGSVAR